MFVFNKERKTEEEESEPVVMVVNKIRYHP